jgi:hypothetical protein
MSRLINPYRGKYTVIPENIIWDKELDYKSRGLLVTLLYLADKEHWDFNEMGLVTISKDDGRASVRSALKKLEELGYLKRIQSRKPNGLMGHSDYLVSEQRMEKDEIISFIRNCTPLYENRTTDINTPLFDFPTTDKPMAVNQTQLRNEVKE